MKFLVDRCAGRVLAGWLREQGHDVVGAWELGPDPGDEALLTRAAADGRVLVTIDTDFGRLVYVGGLQHRGLVRLPDLRVQARIDVFAQILERHSEALAAGAVITVRGGRVRIS